MPDPTTKSRLTGLILSAVEIRNLTSWPQPMVEDYLNILENLITISDILDIEVDQKLEEVSTDFIDGSIPFVDGGFLKEDNGNLSWDDFLKKLQVNALQFDLAPTAAGPGEGEAKWNNDAATVDVGLPGGVVGQMFQELFFDSKNATGSSIPDGTPVMFASPVGASGKIEIQLAIADGSIPSEFIMGITTQAIINGGFGKVTWFGKVRGLDTTGTPYGEVWSDGDLIYVSTTVAGDLTNVEPNAPDQRILVAAVTDTHAVNGTLLLRPTWKGLLTDLDDVNGTPVTVTGQILVWDNINKYFDFNFNITDYQLKADFTEGSVLFRGASIITEDNANFFWDDANDRLGIGTNTPGTTLDVNGIITGDDVVGELYEEGDSIITADSVTLNAGTLITGTVADTRTVNEVYYQVEEVAATPGFDVEFNYTLLSNPGKLTFKGRYQGSVGHNVVVEAWNYTGGTWDSFTGATKDLPSAVTDYEVDFDYADLAGVVTDYISGTDSKFRIQHTSPGNTAHDLFVDYVAIQVQQVVIAAAGVYQTITGFTLGENNNVTMDASNGTMTIEEDGRYLVNMNVSFTGSDNAVFESHLFVDDVKVDKIGLKRKLGSTGDVGSSGFSGIIALVTDGVLKIKVTSDIAGVYAAIENINWNISRLN